MARKIKEKGMLHLKGMNKLVKKVKDQNPKGNIDKLGGVMPDTGTGISYIEGAYYKNKKSKRKKK